MKLLESIKSHWQLIVLVTIIFVLWDYSVVVPLKIFVVFLHEASHAFMVILTDGEVLNLTFNTRQGGSVLSRGGNLFLTASAGYLGSLLLGALFLILALKTKADRIVVGLLGLGMLALTALYIREPFPMGFCVAGGLLLIICGVYLPRVFNDFILRVIGLTSLIYVPFDIFSDTLARSELRSDARIIAEITGIPTLFWGSLWLVISLVILVVVLKSSLKAPSNINAIQPEKKSPYKTR